MLRQGHIRIARHNPLPQTEIAKKGKVLIPSPFSFAKTRSKGRVILTWSLPPLSFLAQDPCPSWAHLASGHPQEEEPVPALQALARAVVAAELVLLSCRIQMLE